MREPRRAADLPGDGAARRSSPRPSARRSAASRRARPRSRTWRRGRSSARCCRPMRRASRRSSLRTRRHQRRLNASAAMRAIMHALGRNLAAGLRLALFLPVERAAFRISVRSCCWSSCCRRRSTSTPTGFARRTRRASRCSGLHGEMFALGSAALVERDTRDPAPRRRALSGAADRRPRGVSARADRPCAAGPAAHGDCVTPEAKADRSNTRCWVDVRHRDARRVRVHRSRTLAPRRGRPPAACC